MDSLFQDLSYGLRSLWWRKGHSAVVVISLGLATGVNITLFSLASTVLFATVPFEDPQAIVFIRSRSQELNRFREPIATPEFLDLRSGLHSVRELAAFQWTRRALTGSAKPIYKVVSQHLRCACKSWHREDWPQRHRGTENMSERFPSWIHPR
jgi:hypothetical protein